MTVTDQPDLVTVRLLEVPVALRFKSAEHGEGLVREMTLLTAREADSSHVPARLVELAAEVRNQYGPFTARQAAAMEDALAAGLAVIPELVYEVPPAVADLARRLQIMLAEADRFCREGEYLLTLATPPDVAALRSWLLGEFVRQVAGEPPIAWPDYRDAHA